METIGREPATGVFVSGFTFVRNAVKFSFPVVESIRSLLPVCDEVVVNVGDSEDDTLGLIRSIPDTKIRIIEHVWNLENRESGSELARQTDLSLGACRGRWCLYLQADEVLHEKDYPSLVKAFKEFDDVPNVEGLLFPYIHFYGSYKTCFMNSPVYYRNEIRAFKNHTGVFSHGDAQGFRKGRDKVRVVPVQAHIHHYGWVRPPEIMAAQKQHLDRWWHGDTWLRSNPRIQNDIYNGVLGLEHFAGTHPAVMRNRVAAQSWAFEPPAHRIHPGGMQELIYRIKKKLKEKGIGEYRNYTPVKPKKMPPARTPLHNICLVRLRSIGDTLLTTPVFRILKKQYPQCRISVVIEPKCVGILEHNPYIDEIILYNKGWQSLKVLKRLWNANFDLTIDFLGNIRSALATIFAGGSMRVGLDHGWRKLAYSHKILCRPYQYVALQNLEFLRPAGIYSTEWAPDIFVTQDSENIAREYIRKSGLEWGNIIGFFPTAAWQLKMWPFKHYVELGKNIIDNLKKGILIFWGPAEEQNARALREQLGVSSACIPKTGMHDVAAFFKGCRAAIGNDSSFSHLAVAAKTPVITLFGPTRASAWSPPENTRYRVVCAGEPCSPCNKWTCDHATCMPNITAGRVFSELKDLLEKVQGAAA